LLDVKVALVVQMGASRILLVALELLVMEQVVVGLLEVILEMAAALAVSLFILTKIQMVQAVLGVILGLVVLEGLPETLQEKLVAGVAVVAAAITRVMVVV
jgi:hypothetical protein